MDVHARLMKLACQIGLSLWGGQSTIVFGAHPRVFAFRADWNSAGAVLANPDASFLIPVKGMIHSRSPWLNGR